MLAAMFLAGFGLHGCQSADNGKVVLRVADWGGAGDDDQAAQIERQVYRDFEKLHPGVEIQKEGIPGSDEYVKKILLGFVAKSEPDVIRLDASSAAVFVDNDVLVDLAPFCKRDHLDLNDFYPNALDVARRGAALYALPVDFTPMVLYYNRKLFDQSGVPYPQDGWAWSDFLDDAQRLTKGDQYGFTFPNWMAGWILWLWTNGGDVMTPDGKSEPAATSPKTVQAAEFIRDMVAKYKVAPTLSQQAAEGAEPFADGSAAMELSGHWNLTSLANAPKIKMADVGIAPIPMAHKGDKPVTVIYESGWSIGKHSRRQELAWEFIKYYTSAAVQRRVQQTGIGVCARKDVSKERAVNEIERKFLSILPSGRQPWGSKIEGYDFVEDEGQRMMDAILKGGKDPRQALQDFSRSVDQELAGR
jgi:multiple sugar transport system substrate-binding protein